MLVVTVEEVSLVWENTRGDVIAFSSLLIDKGLEGLEDDGVLKRESEPGRIMGPTVLPSFSILIRTELRESIPTLYFILSGKRDAFFGVNPVDLMLLKSDCAKPSLMKEFGEATQ